MKFLSGLRLHALNWTRRILPTARNGEPGHSVAAVREELRQLQAEVAAVATGADSAKCRDRKELAALEQRLQLAESEREAGVQRLNELQHALTETVERLHDSEARIGRLDSRLEAERRQLSEQIQQSHNAMHRLEQRLGRALVATGCAFLVAVLAGITGHLENRDNSRVLAEMRLDIKDIRKSMARQLGSLHDSLQEFRSPVPDENTVTLSPPPAGPAGSESGRQAAGRGAAPAQALSDFGFHPHSRYRTRPEMEAFFAGNAREPGVISLDSGLQYRVVSGGIGDLPAPGNSVTFDYLAMLSDGTVIYNSYDEQEPVTFLFEQLKPGLREALQKMRTGAQWEIYIPPDLAYRDDVRKRKRFGYEPIIYFVELRGVAKGDEYR